MRVLQCSVPHGLAPAGAAQPPLHPCCSYQRHCSTNLLTRPLTRPVPPPPHAALLQVVAMCFKGTASRIGGVGFEQIARDALALHAAAYHVSPRQWLWLGAASWAKRI